MRRYHNLLMQLGITPNYAGFSQILFALNLIRQDPEKLQLVTKSLYPAVAKEFGTSWKAVERNIRSTTILAWNRNPTLVCYLAGYPLPARPNASQFMAILAQADTNPISMSELQRFSILPCAVHF